MAKQRIKQVRRDGVVQHYTHGKAPVVAKEAVAKPAAAPSTPLAPAAKRDFSAEYNQFHAGQMIADVEGLYDTMYGEAWREAPAVQESGFDKQGYDAAGLDIDGFDRLGFKDGIHKNGTSFDDASFDVDGNHQATGGEYGPDSFNREGWNDFDRHRSHYDEDGYDSNDRDAFGIDRRGFDGWTNINGTRFDDRGFDADGHFGEYREEHDPEGFDVHGISVNGEPRSAYTDGYDEAGYDPRGDDKHGFGENGLHSETWQEHDPEGFDVRGISAYGKPREAYTDGYDTDGYDTYGEQWDDEGFGAGGISLNGKPRSAYTDGYDEAGYDPRGDDKHGFDDRGLHSDTCEEHDPEGFDVHGISVNGEPREAYTDGYDKHGYDPMGDDKFGFEESGLHTETWQEYDPAGFDVNGMSMNHKPREAYTDGYDVDGYNTAGDDKFGFGSGSGGLHTETWETHDPAGFDVNGMSMNHKPREAYTDGRDAEGLDPFGD